MSEIRQPSRVFVVDDHPLFRRGVASVLEEHQDFEFCGEAEHPGDLLGHLEEVRPDIVVLDLDLKHGSGFDLIKSIRDQARKVKVLVVSAFDETIYAERSLHAGASGYYSKAESKDLLLLAMRKVLQDEIYVSEELRQHLLTRAVSSRGTSGTPEGLTDREFEMLTYYGQGLGTAEIAQKLHLSDKTVGSHRANLMKKLNLKRSIELIQYCTQWMAGARSASS